MSDTRQFDGSLTRQFIQSAGRQRNLPPPVFNYFWEMVVIGNAVAGGWLPLTATLSDPAGALYQHYTFLREGFEAVPHVREDGVIDGTDYLTPRWIKVELWAHPQLGDIYKYEFSNSTVGVYARYQVHDDGSVEFFNNGPGDHHQDFITQDQIVDEPSPTATHWNKNITSAGVPDPNVYDNLSVDLDSPAQPPSVGDAIAMCNRLPILGNHDVNFGNVIELRRTGFNDPLFVPQVIIEWARTPQGLRVHFVAASDSPFAFWSGAPGTIGFGDTNFSPQINYPSGWGRPNTPSNGASVRLVMQAGKAKVASTDNNVWEGHVRARNFLNPSQLLDGFTAYATLDVQEIVGRSDGLYDFCQAAALVAPDPTEPCTLLLPVQRSCRWEKAYAPDDAPVWGHIDFRHNGSPNAAECAVIG